MTRKTLRTGVVVEVADDVDVPLPQARPAVRQTSKPEPPPVPPPVPSVEVQMEGVSSESILQELIATRCLQSRFHRAVAAKAAQALARNSPRDALAWFELLPPAGRVDASGRSMAAEAARKWLRELVLNAVAADRVELRRRAEKGEALSERERLQLRLAELDEGGASPEPAALAVAVEPVPVAAAVAPAPKVITPSIGDIVPLSERTDRPPDPPLRQAKPPVVIDNPPQPVGDPTREGEWDRSENGAKWRAFRERHGDIDYLL
jgi:hypothetical protein